MFRALESTRFEVLELLPRVTPTKLVSKVMPLTVSVPLKLVATGSIVRLPEPEYVLVDKLGALLRMMSAPPLMFVTPE